MAIKENVFLTPKCSYTLPVESHQHQGSKIHNINKDVGVFIGKKNVEDKNEVIFYLSNVWYSGLDVHVLFVVHTNDV
jgi:hypothetical protein